MKEFFDSPLFTCIIVAFCGSMAASYVDERRWGRAAFYAAIGALNVAALWVKAHP